ncbi:hypothetical protein GCM10010286_36480 [Streptomyces toxytricini]|nr:hypothetical protein GCM10010286_36480 [Streptomyces toxytricini]
MLGVFGGFGLGFPGRRAEKFVKFFTRKKGAPGQVEGPKGPSRGSNGPSWARFVRSGEGADPRR